MTSHIIHIYRRDTPRDGAQPEAVHGVVEDVEAEIRYPFRTVEELWHILHRLLPPGAGGREPDR